jgi:hypothetical protein
MILSIELKKELENPKSACEKIWPCIKEYGFYQ